MTVRFTRTFEVGAPPDVVWEFLSDPGNRAAAISVVSDWETTGDGTVTWYLDLPIPLIGNRATVTTRDVERDAGEYVRFTGRSKLLNVRGEHTLAATDTGTEITNEFVVNGKAPGVESFFKRQLQTELRNLRDALTQFIDNRDPE